MTEPKQLILNLFEMALRQPHHARALAAARQQPAPLRRPRLLDRARRDPRGRRVRRRLPRRRDRRLRRVPRRARDGAARGAADPEPRPAAAHPGDGRGDEAPRLRRDLLDHATSRRSRSRAGCRRSTTSPRAGSAGTSSPRYLPNAARNFGLDGEIPHDRRYEIADEYLDVLYKLWEGSWDDDAVVDDRERRDLHRPGEGALHRPRRRDATGSPGRTSCTRRRSARPCSSRRPGRRPASSSPGGTPSSSSPAGARPRSSAATSRPMRDAAVRHGRAADDVKFIARRGRRRRAHRGGGGRQVAPLPSSTRASTASSRTASLPVDLTALPARHDRRARRSRAPGKPLDACPFLPLDATVGQALDSLRGGATDRFFVAGTPTVVADEIERWLDEDGIDGINLRQYHSFDTARDFAELVVPELRRRGRLPEDGRGRRRCASGCSVRGDRLPEHAHRRPVPRRREPRRTRCRRWRSRRGIRRRRRSGGVRVFPYAAPAPS